MMEFPLGNVVTAVATVISVVIANKLSSEQSGKQKIWDFRRQAYGVILSELAAVERMCCSAEIAIREDAYRYRQSDFHETIDTKTSEHMGVLRQRFSDDYLILSDRLIELFEAFTGDLEALDPDEPYPVRDEEFASAVRKHRPLLLAQGRKEMA